MHDWIRYIILNELQPVLAAGLWGNTKYSASCLCISVVPAFSFMHLCILVSLCIQLHVPISIILWLVNALVISRIRYCISVYDFGSKQNLSRVQKVINYSAKVVFGRKN